MEYSNGSQVSSNDIKNATLEAIYWWNRDEFYYHKYFSQLDMIYNNELVLDFFTRKIFEVFLREYAIRRNLSSGIESVSFFIKEIMEDNFFERVKAGETEVIDKLSNKLKVSGKSTTRNTKSLLSKVAFLINPHSFSLFDSLAKKSIWTIYKDTKEINLKHLDNYSGFLNQTTKLRRCLHEEGLFKNSSKILKDFNGTESFFFFSTHLDAFEMRIVDKYLWLLAQDGKRKINNAGYIELHKY